MELSKQYVIDGNNSKPYLAIFCLFLVYSCLSQYVFLSLFGGFCLMLIASFFLQNNFSPVFLYFFGFQWLQVFTFIFYADSKGQSLESLYSLNDPNFFIGMTLIQLVLMAFLASRYLKKVDLSKQTIVNACNKLNEKKIIYAYIICSIVFPIILSAVSSNPSINQLIETFALVRKLLLIIMIFILFAKKSKY